MGDRTRRGPRHGRRRRRRRLFLALGAVLLVLCGAGGFVWEKLDGNLHSVDVDAALGKDRPKKVDTGAEDILVLGSDSRAGANRSYGGGDTGARSDTAMVLHIAKGHRKATLISIPRDTLVDRPACTSTDGKTTVAAASGVMFNSAYSTGGAACAVKTVEKMSGVRLDHFVEVDFTGFKKLVDAVGGVTVDVPQDIDDPYSHLKISKGSHKLTGEQALGLVRTRHGIGDGSDLGRIKLQQAFAKALVAQIKSVGLLGNPAKLYTVADTATKAVTTDSGLGSLTRLAGFAKSLSGISGGSLSTVTLPVETAPSDPNRVVPITAQADALWTAVRHDTALPAASASPGATAGSGTAAGTAG